MKEPLIILHGALGCASQFNEWKKFFSERFNCYTFDFAGHGTKSGEAVEFSIDLFSHNLLNFVSDQKLTRPRVLGYSMGGYVALYSAIHNHDFLGKILTLATKFNWTPESAGREAGYLDPTVMMQKVPQLADQLKERHGVNWQNVVRKTAKMMLSIGDKPPITFDNIKAIKVPVRYCVGDKDKMVSAEETFVMYKATPNASYSVLPGTPHLPELMPFRRIAFEVEDFLVNQAQP